MSFPAAQPLALSICPPISSKGPSSFRVERDGGFKFEVQHPDCSLKSEMRWARRVRYAHEKVDPVLPASTRQGTPRLCIRRFDSESVGDMSGREHLPVHRLCPPSPKAARTPQAPHQYRSGALSLALFPAPDAQPRRRSGVPPLGLQQPPIHSVVPIPKFDGWFMKVST